MKSLFFIPLAFCIFSGVSFTAAAQKHKRVKNAHTSKAISPKFIEGIEMNPDRAATNYTDNEAPAFKNQPVAMAEPLPAPRSNIERSSSLQFKYAQLLNCNVEFIKNISLYNFIDEWWETRYQYGGTTKSGIDCSAFTGMLMSTVFGLNLPRTARDQYNESTRIKIAEMNEGDLVFFNTRGGISHVGLYLGENYFVHASTNSGVTISSLDDPYYSSRFVGGGRVFKSENDLVQKTNDQY
jgi:hypothetical protein